MPPVEAFPHPSEADSTGMLAIGGDLSPETLLLAYRSGIFPWPIEGYPLTWFSPDPRAILDFQDLHVPKRLERTLKKNPFKLTINQAFQKVIKACADIPRGGTWITTDMIEAYQNLHALGHAHSVEAWNDDKLVGGIYGVLTEKSFSAESMFHIESNASKAALLNLIEHLKNQHQLNWMDIQMQSPHMEAFGAKEISRSDYLKLIA